MTVKITIYKNKIPMKKIQALSLLLCFAFIIPACKKKTIEDPTIDSNPSNPSSNGLTIESNIAKPYQTLSFYSESGIFNFDTYPLTIEGVSTQLVVSDPHYAAFIVPDISPGNVTAGFVINSIQYSFVIEIQAHNAISSPETVVQQSIDNEINFLNTTLLPAINSMETGTVKNMLLADYTVAQNYYAEASTNFSSLSSDEKLKAAQFVQANQSMTNDLHIAIMEYVSIVNLNKSIYDNEQESINALTKFTLARVKLLKAAPKILAWAGAGWVLGGPVGAAIGAGVGIGNFLSAFIADGKAQDELMTFKPVVDSWVEDYNKSSFVVQNGGTKTISLLGNYHNINAEHITSGGTKIQNYIQNCHSLLNIFHEIMDVLPDVLSKAPVIVEDVTQVEVKNFDIRAAYVTIGVSSNPSVSIQKVIIDDHYKLTFTTQSLTDENFTFTITYNSPGIKSKTQTISALLVNSPPRNYSGTYTIYESENGAPYTFVKSDNTNLTLIGSTFDMYETVDGTVNWGQGSILSESASGITLKLLKANNGGGTPLQNLPISEQMQMYFQKSGNQLAYEDILTQGTYSQKTNVNLVLVP